MEDHKNDFKDAPFYEPSFQSRTPFIHVATKAIKMSTCSRRPQRPLCDKRAVNTFMREREFDSSFTHEKQFNKCVNNLFLFSASMQAAH